MPVSLPDFLARTQVEDGLYRISPPRRYQHDEGEYEQVRAHRLRLPGYRARQGEALLGLFRRNGFPEGGTVVEIGCGSGFVSLALATRGEIGHLLLTDPSPGFCAITRQRLAEVEVAAGRVDVAVMVADDIDLLPAGAVAVIYLHSVLHHLPDIDGFLARCARVLPAGGLLICEEPYYDGYVMMGFLAQFVPAMLAAAGDSCSVEEQAHVDLFVATMQYYARRDLDKSEAEDKHLFRPEELFVSGRGCGLDLSHIPNRHFALPEAPGADTVPHYFETFFGNYTVHSMGWPKPFADRVMAAADRYFRYFDPLERAGNRVPYCYGTFVFRKRAAG